MSDEELTNPARDPLQYLRTYWPQVRIEEADMPSGEFGATVWPSRGDPVIYLARRLSPVDRRITVCHEMMHLERGEPEEWRQPEEEHQVERQTARWVLPDLRVIRAATKQHGLATAAGLLQVPSDILALRLSNLTEREAYYVYG